MKSYRLSLSPLFSFFYSIDVINCPFFCCVSFLSFFQFFSSISLFATSVLFVHLTVCSSARLSFFARLSICLFVRRLFLSVCHFWSFIHLSFCPPSYLSLSLLVHLFICPFDLFGIFVHLSFLFLCLFVQVSICSFVQLSDLLFASATHHCNHLR